MIHKSRILHGKPQHSRKVLTRLAGPQHGSDIAFCFYVAVEARMAFVEQSLPIVELRQEHDTLFVFASSHSQEQSPRQRCHVQPALPYAFPTTNAGKHSQD